MGGAGVAAEGRADRAEQVIAGERARADAMQVQLAAEAEAADQARRKAQDALQGAEAIAAASARAETDRTARSRWRRLRDAWQGR
jgi:hypothetical protein